MNDNVIPLRPGDPVAELTRAGVPKRLAVHTMLAFAQAEGMTVKELRVRTGWHHGAASGVLSTMHRDGRIARLRTKRERCSVYVLPEFIEDRPASRSRVTHQTLLDEMATMLARFQRDCKHDLPHITCKQCEVAELLRRYHAVRGSSN